MNNYFDNNNILIPFSFFVDIDIGIIRYMRDILPDNKLYTLSDDIIKGKLLNRMIDNPLSLLLDPNKIDIYNIYYELLDTKYKEILDLSDRTDIINILFSTKNLENVNISIWCKDELEKDKLLKIFKPHVLRYTIIEESENPILMDLAINSIFFDNVQDLYKYAEYCKNKEIYLSYYKFNMEYIDGNITLPSGLELLLDPNKIRYIQKYKYNSKYFKEEKKNG